MTRNPVIQFDKLQLYFAEPYVIDVEDAEGTVTLYQPTIGDIVRVGQQRFYECLNPFVINTTTYRLPLWEIGVDWNTFSDFNLFIMLTRNPLDQEVTKLLIGDLDLSKFDVCTKNDDNVVLFDYDSGIEINETVYHHISQYFRTITNIFPEEKITKQDTLKEWFINKDRTQLKIDEEKRKKNPEKEDALLPLISSCVNHPGFKYKTSELRDIHIYEFYDSVKRLQVYESATACMKGLYSGFVSAKDLNPDTYNFMKSI